MSSIKLHLLLAIPSILVGFILPRSPLLMKTAAASGLKPWADGPVELITTPQSQTNETDLFTTGATHMCLLHNTILRGYNSIYNQLPHIQEADKPDFINYCLTWYKFVKSHHDDEEQNLFPRIEELLEDRTIFDETYKEHESFIGGLSEFSSYLTGLTDPKALSVAHLQDIMARFQPGFAHHFHSEVATLAGLAGHAAAPRENTTEHAAAVGVFKVWGRSTVAKGGVADVVPFFLLNLDRTAEGGRWADWPPMPGPVRWVLVNVVGALHSYWWRFASCDHAGRPKELWAMKYVEEVGS